MSVLLCSWPKDPDWQKQQNERNENQGVLSHGHDLNKNIILSGKVLRISSVTGQTWLDNFRNSNRMQWLRI